MARSGREHGRCCECHAPADATLIPAEAPRRAAGEGAPSIQSIPNSRTTFVILTWEHPSPLVEAASLSPPPFPFSPSCCTLTSALCRPLLSGVAGGAVWPAAASLLPARDLLSAPPGGGRRGQRGSQGEGPRHRQQTASPAATGGRCPGRPAETTGATILPIHDCKFLMLNE